MAASPAEAVTTSVRAPYLAASAVIPPLRLQGPKSASRARSRKLTDLTASWPSPPSAACLQPTGPALLASA